ncbi:MAG: hypothetical protein EOP19_19395 [Hyphomicrobiales bacterium]|nr:MAG: hypothetical protein EOP19_19395 [Hyphomicrobiales bacterium]
MVGLVPTIHVLRACGVQDVDARHEGEHDGDLTCGSGVSGYDAALVQAARSRAAKTSFAANSPLSAAGKPA